MINQINYWKVFAYWLLSLLFLWLSPYYIDYYVDTNFPYISKEDIPKELVGFITSNDSEWNKWCPALSPHLEGTDLHLHRILESNILENEALINLYGIQPGGIWHPSECQARYEVVIIVPYRNRTSQLRKFLTYMHPFLQRQQLHYRILVIEQVGDSPFNRARLFNIGFREAQKFGRPNYCLILHDVDLLPENDFNIYACTHHPRHMYSAVDIFRYYLPYRDLLGGAVAILSTHFETVNGFSNLFNGWGGEDDDFSMRLRRKGLQFERFDPQVARYVMMPHKKESPSSNRWQLLKENQSNGRDLSDGLSTLTYNLIKIELLPYSTHLYVE